IIASPGVAESFYHCEYFPCVAVIGKPRPSRLPRNPRAAKKSSSGSIFLPVVKNARRTSTSISGVAVRTLFAPFPCAAHDALQVGELRLPPEFFFDFFGTGHQHRRVARAAQRFFGGNGMVGYSTNRLDHFAHTETLAVAQVVDEAIFFLECFQHEQVSVGQVAHMNVIADTGAVWRRVVGAKNRELVSRSERHLKR